MSRWGIVLDRQLLFATDDECAAQRFMMMPGFQVIDHSTGYYAYMDHQMSKCCDLLPQHEINNERAR